MITIIAGILSNQKTRITNLTPRIKVVSTKTCCAALILLFIATSNLVAQEIQLQQTVLDSFVKIPSAKDKFNYFYKTPNRYKENSSYEWLESIDSMLTKARTAQDDGSIEYYKILQAHIHQDLV